MIYLLKLSVSLSIFDVAYMYCRDLCTEVNKNILRIRLLARNSDFGSVYDTCRYIRVLQLRYLDRYARHLFTDQDDWVLSGAMNYKGNFKSKLGAKVTL